MRYCLQEAMKELGVAVHVVQSDKEFDRIDGNSYDYIFLDPWTWAGPGMITIVSNGRPLIIDII